MSKEEVTYLFLQETLSFLSFQDCVRDLHDLKEHRLLLLLLLLLALPLSPAFKIYCIVSDSWFVVYNERGIDDF
jgi:hypothetical protein